jgi:molybdopterin molybdotransferase
MIQFEEALDIVQSSTVSLEKERVGLNECLSRVLAEDVRSDMQMPPFDKSAVDGFACRKSDLGEKLQVIELVPAGKVPQKTVGSKQCTKLMTGAPVPTGADAVIMVEDVEPAGEGFIRYKKDNVKDNICYTGEDIRKGDVLVQKGAVVQPQQIAVMATAGCVDPLVYKRVKVAVISTGDELVEPDAKPGPGQIRNSNAYQLLAQVNKMGALPDYVGIALDTEASTRNKITKAFDGNDIVLLTGGVSMGDFDYVPAILDELGVQLKFKSIAVQPGRPTVFGVFGKKFIFGLPGNPVSSFVQFELLVKPLIFKMTGHDYTPPVLRMPMAKEYRRKRSGRLSWLPVKIDHEGRVEALEYHGSAHINALTLADGLVAVPIGQTTLEKGELVHVRQI